MSENVFVYGTLKRGFHNFHWLGQSLFVEEALTVEKCFRMGDVGTHPEVTRCDTEQAGYIKGELFLCDAVTMQGLDRLESNGLRYVREKIQVRTVGDLSIEMAWIYLWICPPEPDVRPTSDEDGNLVYEWRLWS